MREREDRGARGDGPAARDAGEAGVQGDCEQ